MEDCVSSNISGLWLCLSRLTLTLFTLDSYCLLSSRLTNRGVQKITIPYWDPTQWGWLAQTRLWLEPVSHTQLREIVPPLCPNSLLRGIPQRFAVAVFT